MKKSIITFRLNAQDARELDAVAASLDRDRSWVLSEAVRAYLELQRWQVRQVQEGVRQADAGLFVSDEEMRRTVARLTRKKR